MLLDEVAAYLAAQGIGTEGADLFKGVIPDAPDACTTILEYGGASPVHALGGGQAKWERPRIQAVVRALTYSAARTKIESVYKTLEALANTTLSSVRYLSVSAIQSPFFLRRDESNRVVLAVNFQIEKELSP